MRTAMRIPMRTAFWFATLFLMLAPASSPVAQSWPQRSVRLITPFPPGAGIDVAARLYAERLAARWGQPVVVENRPGGDGVIGVAAFVNQRDDHTLLFAGSATFTVNPVINDKLPYDSDRDIVPISSAADIFITVTASKSLKAATLADLIREAGAQPGKLNWNAGPGLPQYVFAAFLKKAGLAMTSVSYRELGTALQDLGEGRIQIIVQSITAVMPLVDAGKANVLAVANKRHTAVAPDVPTVVEAGHPELTMDSLAGVFGWRDMSHDLSERIAADIRAIAAEPAVQERLAKLGQAANASTPAEFALFLRQARERIAAIVQEVGKAP
jgi:tripartite-type tricarboxylate transporter receptor subunit TctC